MQSIRPTLWVNIPQQPAHLSVRSRMVAVFMFLPWFHSFKPITQFLSFCVVGFSFVIARAVIRISKICMLARYRRLAFVCLVIRTSDRVSNNANENSSHLVIFSGKMQNIHPALKMNVPHQPARSYMRSRMVELLQVYTFTARLAFLLFLCICELGYLQAILLRTPESHATSFSFLWVELIGENSAGWRVWQTLSSIHHFTCSLPLSSELTQPAFGNQGALGFQFVIVRVVFETRQTPVAQP